MNGSSLPPEGAAAPEIQRLARDTWLQKATAARLDLTGFDPDAPLRERLLWARSHGWDIGVICSRYSNKNSHSTPEQVVESVEFAVRNRMYTPPEFVCVDEAVTGRKSRRAGLDRAKFLMQVGRADVLIIYKLSRLLRTCYKSVAFVQEEIVDQNLRAVSVTQHVDTRDESNWRKLVYLYGLMDEALLTSIGDHVRSGLKQLFATGYCTGALTLGYDPVVTEGPLTKLGRPRTKPQLNEEFKQMFSTHVDLHLGGMSIAEGARRWVAQDGARDPRSKKGRRMSYGSYRRMLSNPRYTGLWAFGKMRNVWMSRREFIKQREQPEADIVVCRLEELRAVEDDRFVRLQQWLAKNEIGPRAPRSKGPKQIWDYTTKFFVCGAPDCQCHGDGFYQGKAHNPTMYCKEGFYCPHHVIVRRDKAVMEVLDALGALLQADETLVTEVVAAALLLDADTGGIEAEIGRLEQRRTMLTAKIDGLLDLVGGGTQEEQQETRAKLGAARQDRQSVDCELHLARSRTADREPLDPERIRGKLKEFKTLLQDAGAGRLGENAVFRAVRMFELLTGGRITVEAVQRPGRKQKSVRGHFQLNIITAVLEDAGYGKPAETTPTPVTVWLRHPPQCDDVAERVHQLVDVEGFSFPEVADRLKSEGMKIVKAGVERSYRRYYQMRGEPVPKRAYNNGRRRRSAKIPIAVQYAERVMELVRQKIHLKDIGPRLGLKKDQVTRAYQWWHSSRGLPIPDGRTRRKELELKIQRSA